MKKYYGFLFFLPFCAALAMAGPIIYDVTVNTSSITGTSGSLDFNFNPGPLVSQAVSLQILAFTSDGMLAGACPCGTGDVNGQLPATLTFDNGTGFNDYFDDFAYGTTISFAVSLYGPALSAPDGVSTSGSTFAFSMFSDSAGTIPVLTTDTTEGFAVTIGVNLDGSTTVTDDSSQTAVNPVGGATAPEPGTAAALGMGIAALILLGQGAAPGPNSALPNSALRTRSQFESNRLSAEEHASREADRGAVQRRPRRFTDVTRDCLPRGRAVPQVSSPGEGAVQPDAP